MLSLSNKKLCEDLLPLLNISQLFMGGVSIDKSYNKKAMTEVVKLDIFLFVLS